jgi:hypothetical protein
VLLLLLLLLHSRPWLMLPLQQLSLPLDMR